MAVSISAAIRPLRPTRCVRSAAVFFLLGHGCLVFGASQTTDNTPLLGRVVRKIEFRADRPVNRAHLDPLVGIQPGVILTRASLKTAIQKLHDTGRFSDIVVDASPLEDGVMLTFALQLNFYFNEFTLSDGPGLKDRRIWEVIPLPVGERYTRQRLEEARGLILQFLKDRGYFQAQVHAVPRFEETTLQVDTLFEVARGDRARIGALEIRGVPLKDAPELRRKLQVRPGRWYDKDSLRKQLDAFKHNLLKRGFLEASVNSNENFDPIKNMVSLDLEVKNYGMLRVSVGGFNIPRDRQRALLPILSSGGIERDLREEGRKNLQEYLEERGFPQAEISLSEEADAAGVRNLRYQVSAGRKVRVAEVEFKNNPTFSAKQLLPALQLQPATWLRKSAYSVQKLDSDEDTILSKYQAAGFLDAKVVPFPYPVKGVEALRLTFEIEEGSQARVREVVLHGNTTLPSESLISKMTLRPGEAYSPHRAERDRQAVMAAYNDAGFSQPRVIYRTGEPDASNSYRVEFEISEGPRSFVGDVIILGYRRTDRSVIESRIRFERNQPLSLGRMLETQQALYNLGIFDRVRVSPQNPESSAPYQEVVVRVEEAKQIITGYGLGYQEREGPRGTVELHHLNIFGSGRRADFRLRGSRLEQSVVFSSQRPQMLPLPRDTYFSFTARQKREVSFDSLRVSLAAQYSHPVGSHSWTLLRYAFRNVRISNAKVTDIGRENAPRNLSTASAIYVNDTRDNFLDPERGFFSSTDLSLTPKFLGSSNEFLSLYTQNHYYRKLPGSLLLAVSLQFGAGHPFGSDRTLPISERFFAGGGSSLRGFDTDRAGPLDPVTGAPTGGNALLVGNLELKVPFFRFLQFAGFYDVGNVFRSLDDVSLSQVSHTLGAGLRIKTPFGPIRLDYGFNLSFPERGRKSVFINIGSSF